MSDYVAWSIASAVVPDQFFLWPTLPWSRAPIPTQLPLIQWPRIRGAEQSLPMEFDAAPIAIASYDPYVPPCARPPDVPDSGGGSDTSVAVGSPKTR